MYEDAMRRLALVLSLPLLLTVCTAGDEEPVPGGASPPTGPSGSTGTVAAQAGTVVADTSLVVCPEGSNPDAPGSPVTVTIGIKAVALRAARAAAVSKL